MFAQARDEETLSPKNFLLALLNNTMQTYPGATCNYDFRLSHPREFIEYWPSLLETHKISHKVHLENGEVIGVVPAHETAEVVQDSENPKTPFDADGYGEMIERVEFPHIHAVHFLNRELLGKGVASTGAYDSLAGAYK